MPPFFLPANTFSIEDEDVGSLVKWIAHDAAIYPGNSGGPLVDLSGHIVGINEIKVGLSGAIPGNLAHEVAQQIIARGAVERGWIGLVCQPLLRNSAAARGALVADVTVGSPAEAAGFQAGDVLQSLNGNAVDV